MRMTTLDLLLKRLPLLLALACVALADSLDGGTTWRTSGEKFRAAMTVERWSEALAKVRGPLGATQQRTAASTTFSHALPGVPDGDYATIEFRTAFARKAESSETVRLEREHDGAWRVIGYFIR